MNGLWPLVVFLWLIAMGTAMRSVTRLLQCRYREWLRCAALSFTASTGCLAVERMWPAATQCGGIAVLAVLADLAAGRRR